MPRRSSRRAASEHPFPGGDGASASTSRIHDAHIPQLLPSSDAVAMATARRMNGAATAESSPGVSARRGLTGVQEEGEGEADSSVVEEQEQSFEEGEGHEGEDVEEQEDMDEEMADDSRLSIYFGFILVITNPFHFQTPDSPPPLSPLTSAKSPPSHPGPYPRTNPAAASRPCATPLLPSSGNPTGRNHIP